MPLHASLVVRHDARSVLWREHVVKVQQMLQFVHEWKREHHECAHEPVHKQPFIFFRLEQADMVHSPKTAEQPAVELHQGLSAQSAQRRVRARQRIQELAPDDRRRQHKLPELKGRELPRVFFQDTMQEGCTAPRYAYHEYGFLHFGLPVSREKDLVQKKRQRMHQPAQEQRRDEDALKQEPLGRQRDQPVLVRRYHLPNQTEIKGQAKHAFSLPSTILKNCRATPRLDSSPRCSCRMRGDRGVTLRPRPGSGS